MSCPDFVISERGRAAIGVGQGIPAGDYPLVAPSDDIAGLIADMHLAYDDLGLYAGQQPKKEPLSIKYLAGFGCLPAQSGVPNGQHAADIQIVDADGAIVFNSFSGAGITYTKTSWSADYDIHEWRSEYAVCRVVTYKTWPKTDINDTDATTARNYASKISPASAVINARAVYKMPKRLLSVRVNTANVLTNKIKGEIVFKNGYNTELAVTPPTVDDFRTNTRITLTGVAGSGLGRFFNCAETDTAPVITTINGVNPRNGGDFVIGGKDCLWSTHPVAAPAENDGTSAALVRDSSAGIKFGADCKACCSCEDYSAAADYMNQVAYRYQLIGQRAQEVYTQHEANVANWAGTSCGTGEVLRMVARSQECGAIDVAITLCNTCDTCIPAAALTLDMYVPEPPDVPVPLATQNIFIRHAQSQNVHGNQLAHDVDCSYTKLSGAPIDTPINIDGSFESQFGIFDVIDAAGKPVYGTFSGNTPAIPQIKPKSLVWPTFVPNVFTADTPTTEMLYDPGPENCEDYTKIWNQNKNNPDWNWRSEAAFYKPAAAYQAVHGYGIRVEDNDPVPTILGVDIVGYLQSKYAPRSGVNFVGWEAVGKLQVMPSAEGDTLVYPTAHDRWWSPIGGVDYSSEQVNGKNAVRTYEMINEGDIGAIVSEAEAVVATATRLNIAADQVANDIFIGVLAGDFASDVTPAVGMSVVDKFGLFSSWSPVDSGVNGFWPAAIKAVHVETGDNFKIVWLRIKRPEAPNTTFPDMNIDFVSAGTGAAATKEKTVAAQAFKTIRFYDMNIFNEHVKLSEPGGFVMPWVAGIGGFNRLASVTNTTSIYDAVYSKPSRYIRAQTPRRVTISTPAVNPGSTIQIDFRITLRELSLLAYAADFTTENWPTCSDAAGGGAAPLKFCAGSDFAAGSTPIYEESARLQIISGSWSVDGGVDGVFYVHIPAKSAAGISHPNGTASCPPPLGFPACSPLIIPKYWRLLRWTKKLDVIVSAEELLPDEEYLAQYACSSDGVFNGEVTKTQLPQTDTSEPAKTRVKVCGYTYADSGKPLTKRKVTPRGEYSIGLVLTGKKPTGSTADLTKQHILDKACEGTAAAKKAYIAENVRLYCDNEGRTPSC